jgi:CubicO group peptidase (beta-lactamase class C family)
MKKFLKWTGIVLLSIVLLVETGLVVSGNAYVNKVLYMTIFQGKTGPDIDELKQFPYHEVDHARSQPWPVAAGYNNQPVADSMPGVFARYQTVGFLVIKDDSLLYEKYWEGYDEHSVVNSFSMAKSINAILIGVALKEGLIKSVDEPVANYLPEFAQGEKSKITIKHLLTMSSGLDFKEGYGSPFEWPAEAYYGADVNAITVNVGPREAPGKTWLYKGGDSQLLGMILKKVTGKKVADYASEKLWKPIGAEEKAFWSTDDQGMEKVSCCFYTTARDYARIARLYMQQGNWNGQQIVDSSYVRESLTVADLTDDKDGKKIDKYGYQWWLLDYKGHHIFYMRGIRGQYVFAIPDMNMIVVRLGHKRDPIKVDDMPVDVFTYLDCAMGMH